MYCLTSFSINVIVTSLTGYDATLKRTFALLAFVITLAKSRDLVRILKFGPYITYRALKPKAHSVIT